MNAKQRSLATLLLTMVLPAFAGAAPKATERARAQCAAIVKSQGDAIDKADWIVEALVDSSVVIKESGITSLLLSDIKTIRSGWHPRKIYSGMVQIGPCFVDQSGAVASVAFDKFTGKRMRIFGSRHWNGDNLRAFYIEPVTLSLATVPPVAPLATLPSKTLLHGNNATNPLDEGWHRAKSTDGKFKIDMPGPFMDVTSTITGPRVFVIRASSPNGIHFVAVREPNEPEPEMARIFDAEMASKKGKIGAPMQFKGVPAWASRTVQGELVSHSLMFRVPGGTFMLGMASPLEKEKEALAMRERFYNSLSFE